MLVATAGLLSSKPVVATGTWIRQSKVTPMKGKFPMSRKDYEAIAVEINSQVNLHKDSKYRLIVEAALFGVAQAMALRFANDNPRFNYSKFMVACGMRNA